MTKVKPATDEEIATIRDYEVYHGDTQALIGRLVARHYADREENAGLKAYIASYKDGMKALRATDAAEIAALKKSNEAWRAQNDHLTEVAQREIAALKAEVETVRGCLHELAATVRGEAPSLLNEDSGGDAFLSMRIDAALGTGRSR